MKTWPTLDEIDSKYVSIHFLSSFILHLYLLLFLVFLYIGSSTLLPFHSVATAFHVVLCFQIGQNRNTFAVADIRHWQLRLCAPCALCVYSCCCWPLLLLPFIYHIIFFSTKSFRFIYYYYFVVCAFSLDSLVSSSRSLTPLCPTVRVYTVAAVCTLIWHMVKAICCCCSSYAQFSLFDLNEIRLMPLGRQQVDLVVRRKTSAITMINKHECTVCAMRVYTRSGSGSRIAANRKNKQMKYENNKIIGINANTRNTKMLDGSVWRSVCAAEYMNTVHNAQHNDDHWFDYVRSTFTHTRATRVFFFFRTYFVQIQINRDFRCDVPSQHEQTADYASLASVVLVFFRFRLYLFGIWLFLSSIQWVGFFVCLQSFHIKILFCRWKCSMDVLSIEGIAD